MGIWIGDGFKLRRVMVMLNRSCLVMTWASSAVMVLPFLGYSFSFGSDLAAVLIIVLGAAGTLGWVLALPWNWRWKVVRKGILPAGFWTFVVHAIFFNPVVV
jgi:hypothetical protein